MLRWGRMGSEPYSARMDTELLTDRKILVWNFTEVQRPKRWHWPLNKRKMLHTSTRLSWWSSRLHRSPVECLVEQVSEMSRCLGAKLNYTVKVHNVVSMFLNCERALGAGKKNGERAYSHVWGIGKFRIPRLPWDEHDWEANAGQLLRKNKTNIGNLPAASLENDRNLKNSKISKLKLYQ